MLKNFNPSFILDLTATPKSNSNVISYVDAAQLKRENMVKLPVIVYNRILVCFDDNNVPESPSFLDGSLELQIIGHSVRIDGDLDDPAFASVGDDP